MNGRPLPRDNVTGIDRVDSKYSSRRPSRAASLVDQARPNENAILASIVLTLLLGS